MELTFEPQPHEEAIALIKDKPIVTREVFDGLLPELRGRAFTITGVEGANVMQRVRDVIAGLAEGGEHTWDKVKEEVIGDLETYLGDGAERRATLLMRTHGFQAFQASNWRVAQEDADTTHLQYLATEDDRVRATHLALNGLILPKDDPFWDTHFPPWEWNCRCRVRPMNPDLVDEARADDADRSPDDRLVVEGPALKKLREGTLIRDGQAYDVTPPVDTNEKNPFQWHPDDLRLSLDELEKRYDPEVWEAFTSFARETNITPSTTLWEWLNGERVAPEPAAKRRARKAPALNPVATILKRKEFSSEVVAAAQALPDTASALLENAQFHASTGGAFYRRDNNGIYLRKDPKTWHGGPMTFLHEAGHHVHYETNVVTRSGARADFKTAIEADFAGWKKIVQEKHGLNWHEVYRHGKGMSALNAVAETLGIASFEDATMADQKRVSRIADTIMGLSDGQYGQGHSVDYMQRNGAAEVFAHAFSALMEGDQAFKNLFPNVVNVVRELLGL